MPVLHHTNEIQWPEMVLSGPPSFQLKKISWLTLAYTSGPGTNKTAAPATAVSPQLKSLCPSCHPRPAATKVSRSTCQVSKHLLPFHATSDSHKGMGRFHVFSTPFHPKPNRRPKRFLSAAKNYRFSCRKINPLSLERQNVCGEEWVIKKRKAPVNTCKFTKVYKLNNKNRQSKWNHHPKSNLLKDQVLFKHPRCHHHANSVAAQLLSLSPLHCSPPARIVPPLFANRFLHSSWTSFKKINGCATKTNPIDQFWHIPNHHGTPFWSRSFFTKTTPCPQTLAFPSWYVYCHIYIYINNIYIYFSICLYYVICYRIWWNTELGTSTQKKVSMFTRYLQKVPSEFHHF